MGADAQLKIKLSFDDIHHVLKFANNADAVDWKKCLLEWKDYNLEHGQAYYKSQNDHLLFSEGSSGQSVGDIDVSLSGLEAGLSDDIPTFKSNIGEEKPAVKQGYIEMDLSSSRSFGGKDWQSRYAKIDGRTGEFCIYNSEGDTACIYIIKCVNMQSITPYSKRGGDKKRFNLTTVTDEVFKFRCASDGEGEAWLHALNEWKDYALLNMSFT